MAFDVALDQTRSIVRDTHNVLPGNFSAQACCVIFVFLSHCLCYGYLFADMGASWIEFAAVSTQKCARWWCCPSGCLAKNIDAAATKFATETFPDKRSERISCISNQIYWLHTHKRVLNHQKRQIIRVTVKMANYRPSPRGDCDHRDRQCIWPHM